jgi:Uma2 family endonuclease
MTILIAQPDQDMAEIPEWVRDIQSFRRWACSDQFPQSGSYSHLGGKLWVDTSMEQFAHNQIKGKVGAVLTGLAEGIHDWMLLTHIEAGISTEPDGMFVSHAALRSGRAKLEKGPQSLEVIGTPDMVLEVVSRTSRQKDKVVLPNLYHKAGIQEYWIVERNLKEILFELLIWQPNGYAPAPVADGWVQSPVFGKQFRFEVTEDCSGLELYLLKVQ